MRCPYPTPPIETLDDPIHSPEDLRQRWRAMMEPLGFHQRILYFVFVGPDRCFIRARHDLPVPPQPDPAELADLFDLLSELLDDLGPAVTVAFLLTRPGRGPVSRMDRRWATALGEAAARAEVPVEAFFRANSETLLLVEPDAQVR